MTRRIPPVRYRVFVAAGSRVGGDGDLPALFDMLRYEAARVTDWARDRDPRDRAGWRITIESEHFTEDRWRSFGIYPEVMA